MPSTSAFNCVSGPQLQKGDLCRHKTHAAGARTELCTHIENKVMLKCVSTPVSIVPIDASARAVVTDVGLDRRVGGQRVKHARRLLAGHADLVHVVVAKHVVVGVGAACRVNRIAQSEERDGRVALQPCTRCAAVCRGGSNTCFRQLALVFTCNCAPSVRVQSRSAQWPFRIDRPLAAQCGSGEKRSGTHTNSRCRRTHSLPRVSA